MNKRFMTGIFVISIIFLLFSAAVAEDGFLEIMEMELQRSMENLSAAADFPMYFLQYSVNEQQTFNLTARNGGFEATRSSRRCYLDVDVRVGDMSLDNTHEIRGGSWVFPCHRTPMRSGRCCGLKQNISYRRPRSGSRRF
jgi:hypothetical protein